MIQLGRRHGTGPVPLTEIAQAENLPLSYLEHLVARLRKAELVASTRGAHGGYELTAPPGEITMAAVVHALEGNLAPMQCFEDPASSRVLCNHELDGHENCATKLLWTRVQGGVARALEQTTLAELVQFAARGAAAPVTPPMPSRHATRRRPGSRPTAPTRS